MTNIERARMERRQRNYAQLRAQSPDLYRRCVEAASGIGINFNLDQRCTADIEAAIIAAAVGEL